MALNLEGELGQGCPAGQRAGRPGKAVGGEREGLGEGPLLGCGIWARETRLGGLGPGSSGAARLGS